MGSAYREWCRVSECVCTCVHQWMLYCSRLCALWHVLVTHILVCASTWCWSTSSVSNSITHRTSFFPTSLVFCVKYKRSRFVFMSFSSTKEISLLSVVIGISTIESVSLWWNRTGEKIKGATLSVVSVSDGCGSSDCASLLSLPI